jgi:hypothetical protein
LAFPYFAILNSRIGNGQTPGKKWMHIQVTDVEGKTISFGKSSLRYVLFAVPYYLDNIAFPTTRAGVKDLTLFNSNADTRKRILIANVRCTGRADQQELLAKQIARVILQNDPNVGGRDSLRIVTIRGYDLGIAHAEVSRFFEHSPAKWNKLLSGNSNSMGTAASPD